MTARILAIAATLLFAAPAGAASAAPSTGPLTPAALHSAYGLPRAAAKPHTVAIVVAYNDPTIQRDLMTFSRRFALPGCTGAHGCLRRVNQRGLSRPLPPPDPTGGNWTTEAALSTETVHGICQNCRLLVVEADSEAAGDLAASVDTAVRLGAREVVTTYNFAENTFSDALAGHYDHPGVAITAATGDQGFSFDTNVPASYPGVVAVGGTTLRLGRADRWARETVWKASDGTSASGCSMFTFVPSWQSSYSARAGCAMARAVPDVAAAAGPGAPLYSSTALDPQGQRGWFEADGTSLSSPIVAGVFALAGGIGAGQSAPEMLYSRFRKTPSAFHDVTRGASGSCGGRSICQARRGYDGVTGVGTPHGLKGF